MSDPRVSNPYATQRAGVDAATGPSALGVKPDARLSAAFLTQAFLWMFVGLLVTAGVAFFVQSNDQLVTWAQSNLFILFIAQLALVFAIGLGIKKISATVALGLFFVYAASLGITIGLIVMAYTETSVVTAFVSASAIFGSAAIYGAVTKRSLVGLGPILFMGVIGLLVAMILNIFLNNGTVSLIISIIGVVIFTALTAYDVQRIQNGDLAVATGSMEKGAVLAALSLYLDFINIFLFLLRIFGGRN
jgi:FtsH-binding integral membrane protein